MRSAFGLGLIAAGIGLGTYTLARSEPVPEAATPSLSLTTLPDPVATPKGLAIPATPDRPAERRIAAAPVVAAPTQGMPYAPATARLPHGQELTRALQRELRRAGCYEGRINGNWTPATKSAMKAFTERVNARLPVDRPDIVLLALLQGERGAACGSCPAGQGPGPGGDCLPAAIVARAARETNGQPALAAAPRPEAAATIVAARTLAPASATGAPPIEGRMSIGGPKPASAASLPAGALGFAAPSDRPGPGAASIAHHAAHQRGHRLARVRWHAYPPLRRPMRFAYRPVYGLRGLAGLLFGPAR
jgi:peptidoglycan hydrolase-like protein with peptidoglycan-binding domain